MTGTGPAARRGTAVGLLLGATLLGACVTEERREPIAARPAELAAVSLTLRSDRSEYASGQPVALVLEMINRGAVPVSMATPTSQLYDFTVVREGTEVWRWSEGKLFTAQITEVVLGPGQTGQYKAVWDGKGKDGRPAPPGRYTVTGVWIGSHQLGLQPLSLPFTMR